jgi:hypothetical protein
MIFAFFMIAFGGFLTWAAVMNWRHRGEEKISVLEAVILKTTGVAPLPLTRLDRWLQKFHIAFATIFGPLLLLVGSYGLLSELGLL